jgi:hypothetical protein
MWCLHFLGCILLDGDKVVRIVFGRFLQRRSLGCGRFLKSYINRGVLIFLRGVFGKLKYL